MSTRPDVQPNGEIEGLRRRIGSKQLRMVLATVAAASVALAGCSSSGNGGGGGATDTPPASTGTPPASTGTPPASTGSSGSPAPSGAPIKLMVITDIASQLLALPQVVQGAKAAVNLINAAGGVNGHPIDLLSCNSQADPNASAACARQAVTDHVSAVVGLESLQSGPAVDVLQAAGIASIGSTDLSQQDQTSPISFPIQAGSVQPIAQIVQTPGWNNCKRPAFLTSSDIPTIVAATKYMLKVYETLPTPVTPRDVTIPTTTVDVRPQVAELLSNHPDCVFTNAPQQITLPALEAIHASGQTPKITVQAAVAPAEKMKALGAAADGVYSAGTYFQFPGTSPAGDAFAKAFDAIDPKGELDPNAMSAYSAVYMFATVCASLTDFSAKNVLGAFDSAKNIKTPIMGVIPSFPANSGIPGAPRISIFNFYAYQWNNGKYSVIDPAPLNVQKYVKLAIPS